jgi:hypothetical protein
MTTESKEKKKAAAAWDEGWSEAARDYHRNREKPVTNGAASHAPGLEWRTQKDGRRVAFWIASAPGSNPAHVSLWSGIAEPTADDRKTIARECARLQSEMLERTNSTAQPAQAKPPPKPSKPPAERKREPPLPADNPENYGAPSESPPEPPPTPRKPIQWLDMSNWDSEPRPEREWAILNRVPLNQAGLFSGEGGGGKSILEMMKDVAHVTGKDWLGSLPILGPAIYLGAEDDEKEIHIRFYDIAAHYGVTFKELIDGGLHVLCKLGEDATLCAVGKSGRVETTALYRQIYEAAGDIKPRNISIDTLSRAFAGNEIDRVQVYAFAMHMQALAMVARGSVTVLSHPSLQGISSGSGISGSTAWHGAFRFRQYLKSIKETNDDQPDTDLRELEFKKNQ